MWEDFPVLVCPKCGEVGINKYSDEKTQRVTCDYCDYPMKDKIDTGYKRKDWVNAKGIEDKKLTKELRERYVFCPDNKFYSEEAYKLREIKEAKEWEEIKQDVKRINERASRTPRLTCPKCGSTNFTPLRRKWSLLTGFMTNKVDMVCNDCGCVVKK